MPDHHASPIGAQDDDSCPTWQQPPPLQSHLQFARALCDELNNPLMAAAGHLQLLELALDQDPETAKGYATAVSRALARVRDRITKVAALARAGAGDRRNEPVAVDSLLESVRAGLDSVGVRAELVAQPATHGQQLSGDPELLAQAMVRAARITDELMEHDAVLQITAAGGRLQILAELPSPRIPDWQRTTSPVQLCEIRGHPHLALDLFYVQAVAETHGGSAVLERRAQDPAPRIRIDLGRLS